MDLGDRMKEYESVSKIFMTRRTPVIIRLDGKAFHTFTKGLKKPYDETLGSAMQGTMKYLCENIQGCILGYTQSDEISLLLTDWATNDTNSWFDNNIQKMVSISASLATLYFNKFICEIVEQAQCNINNAFPMRDPNEEDCRTVDAYEKKLFKATFDSRTFNLPKEEVVNYFVWRQQDCTKNSITMLAQAYFSHKQLQGKNGSQKQDMLMLEKGVNWNDVQTKFKRGSCSIRKLETIDTTNGVTKRNRWTIDNEIPIFTQDRTYIEKLL